MIPFCKPDIDQTIIDEVADVLRSGWITTGPRTKTFERRLALYAGVPDVLCVNSATSGLELMLRWFGVKKGDEVIIPAYTYCATGNVVLHTGAKPVIVDVDDDFNMSVQNVRDAVTSRTKAIIPVDVGGWPCRYDDLAEVAEQANGDFVAESTVQAKLGRVLLLSDAAHSLGARYSGRMAASFADCSVFSFHAVKNLTTAEGGAICLNLPEPFDNRDIYNHLCVTSLHGQSKDALAKSQDVGWEYDVVEAGYKLNMSDIAAAMGLVQLGRYEDTILRRRREIFTHYCDRLSRFAWAQLPEFESGSKRSSFHCFLLRIRNINEQKRNLIIEHIFKQQVSVNVHFKPLPLLSLYQGLGFKIADYPVALDNYSREVSLPVYRDLTDNQIKQVVDTVVSAVESQT